MPKRSLRDLTDLKGKRVLIRVDFNVPLEEKTGEIADDRRIRAALPTIKYVLDAGANAIVMSHLGRPKGDAKKDAPFKTDKVAKRLGELLGQPVRKVDEVIGPAVSAAAQALQAGQVLVLENLRFHPGEQEGDEAFAKQLAVLGDVYVNDAFGTCHRTDASMYAAPKAMAGKPRVVGFLVAKELEILGQLLSNPKRPLVAVLGGAKVSDKIGFIKAMLQRVDKLLIGGAMANTFAQAQGKAVGNSRVEADKIDAAEELLKLGGERILLPVDRLVADKPDATATTKIAQGDVPDGWEAMDIGPKTIQRYSEEIARAGTVVWNGPVGKFEDEPFSKGTRFIAQALANSPATTIVGGGETAEAVEVYGVADSLSHVSTGGGAFLEYVEGKPFKALEVIEDK
jgi:phosphoglycerate kinase